jgi:hypothetical protein
VGAAVFISLHRARRGQSSARQVPNCKESKRARRRKYRFAGVAFFVKDFDPSAYNQSNTPSIMFHSVLRLGNSGDDSRKFEVPTDTERGFPGERCWFFAVLLLSAFLRLWRLDRNGYGNRYYSAGVRSMLESWHNFFFNSFDPAGFVSLDKPPVAFWIQVFSAKVLGFSGVSVLLPQAVEGVAAVAVLYGMVRRSFGPWAGLLAAFFLAITPISIADDRSSNADSCLVLVLLLAGWALLGAARAGSRVSLLRTHALITATLLTVFWG